MCRRSGDAGAQGATLLTRRLSEPADKLPNLPNSPSKRLPFNGRQSLLDVTVLLASHDRGKFGHDWFSTEVTAGQCASIIGGCKYWPGMPFFNEHEMPQVKRRLICLPGPAISVSLWPTHALFKDHTLSWPLHLLS